MGRLSRLLNYYGVRGDFTGDLFRSLKGCVVKKSYFQCKKFGILGRPSKLIKVDGIGLGWGDFTGEPFKKL